MRTNETRQEDAKALISQPYFDEHDLDSLDEWIVFLEACGIRFEHKTAHWRAYFRGRLVGVASRLNWYILRLCAVRMWQLDLLYSGDQDIDPFQGPDQPLKTQVPQT
jgi:hypothetical protein